MEFYVPAPDLDTIVSLAKRRGFVFPSAEIYGGFANTYDYGPLGVELKRNIRDSWWRAMVRERDDVVGIDAAMLTNPEVWVASGHTEAFNDPLVDCKGCRQRFRPDHIDEGQYGEIVRDDEGRVRCPNCGGELTEPRLFNLMFQTQVGPVVDEGSTAYLPPETAQGMFVNFENVRSSMRRKLPFGIAQTRNSFRNEITPGRFIFRTLEFECMEVEFFCRPADAPEWHRYWIDERQRWHAETIGIDPSRIRIRPHTAEELSHYSDGTSDIEYQFPWGWGELEGIANRTDYDLKAHSTHSGQDLTYFDEETRERFTPYVIEPALGLTRTVAVALIESYTVEPDEKGDERVLLKLPPAIAPIKVAVLPLSKKATLTPTAKRVHALIRSHWMTQYDETQSIGRRYRRQDEIGTPLCVTVDFDTLEDEAVTIRERDSQAQVRVPIAGLVDALRERLPGVS